MSISFHPLAGTFAARAEGADLQRKPSAEEVSLIDAALAQYGVVVFPNQPLDEARQDAFIRCFGQGRNGTFREAAGVNPNFIDVGTVDDEGRPIPRESSRYVYMLANRLWHTDGSFNVKPLRLTALLARELPPVPPPTEFADMRAAWEALPPARQAQLEGLAVVHSMQRSREQIGMETDQFDPQTLRDHPPVVHPLVRSHPLNGRKALYVASHASHIVGWPLGRGRALVEELIAWCTQPRFVYAHEWKLHDLVVWDDRWTLHRATPYDGPHPRKMRQCAVYEDVLLGRQLDVPFAAAVAQAAAIAA